LMPPELKVADDPISELVRGLKSQTTSAFAGATPTKAVVIKVAASHVLLCITVPSEVV
jgi:hypothetical protein